MITGRPNEPHFSLPILIFFLFAFFSQPEEQKAMRFFFFFNVVIIPTENGRVRNSPGAMQRTQKMIRSGSETELDGG